MARARSFGALIALLEQAEEKLRTAGGITDPEQRLLALRGIYYGTTWSADFRAERSEVRNVGFTLFTGFGRPPDPRPVLGEALFKDLQESQDVVDGEHRIDVGHALIGMEARTTYAAREVTIPLQGGTGLELVTWLGDLGGGAAHLIWRRSAGGAAARRSVSTVFSVTGSDYGASINLEGDMAGYLIGAGTAVAAPAFGKGGVTDLFRAYLPVDAASRARHARRCRDFLTMLGGKVEAAPATRLTNRTAVVGRLSVRIRDFSVAYLLQRYIMGQGRPSERVQAACKLLDGTATEVATAFVMALERGIRAPRQSVRGMPPWPAPSPPAASCTNRKLWLAAREREATDLIDQTVREGRQQASEWLRELESLF